MGQRTKEMCTDVTVLTGGDFESVEKGPQFVPTPPKFSKDSARSVIPVSNYPIIHSQGLLSHLFLQPESGPPLRTRCYLSVCAHVYMYWLRSQMYLIGCT